MDWLFLSIVVLMLSSRTWSFECPEAPGCDRCQLYPEGQLEVQCTISNNVAFKVRIQPSKSVAITCLGNPNWTDFHLGEKNPIKDVRKIYFERCNLPKTGLAAVTKQLLADKVSYLNFQLLNNGTTFTRETLRGLNSLQELVLSFNNLSNLTEDILQDLENLTFVNLVTNKLEKVPENFFGNSNLRTIELGSNRLETFEVHTFDRLPNLRLLNIWQNKLRNLLPHTFDGLISLDSLDMNRNFLESLPKEIFKNMKKLRVINLSQNNFTGEALPGDLFKDNVELEKVTMMDNKRNMTSLPNGFFANLTKLEVVKLRKNGLIELPEDLFWGTRNLKNLSIERNFLYTLPNKIFKDTTKIVRLDLIFNDLSYLPDDVFEKLGKLEFLDLSLNRLTSVSEKLFAGLRSLEELRMNRNGLKTIDIRAFIFTPNLKVAFLMNNELTLKSTLMSPTSFMLSPFHGSKNLEELYLSHNNVTNIFEDWTTSLRLKILDLSYNQLQVLRDIDLQFLSQNLRVNLDYNNVTYIDLTTVEVWAVERRVSSVSISIENNPIRCDCRVYDFLRYLEGRLNPKVMKTFQLLIGESKCHGPSDFHDTAITDLRSKTLKCNVNEQDHKVKCPGKCKCYMRPENNTFIVDCGYKGLMEAPQKLDFPPNLRIDHVELNLTGNYLTQMPDLDQNGYNKVTSLMLDHNNISSVTIDGLSNKLEVLNLSNNNIIRMSSDAINFLKNATTLQNLSLEANPWLCDCDARDFLNFIQSKRVSNPELLKVKCNDYDVSISEMTPEELCPTEATLIIAGCLTIAAAGVIIGTLAAIYYRYQQEIKIWLYAHQCCLWFVTEDELDRDKLYDAFVSYSHKDDDFVENNILQKLEEGPRPYKLCIHTRDWLAGEWIPEQIARSVEESRRTIVILSPNFIESVWGRMEFRAAHCQALKEGRARVIIVMYGEIGSTENLDPELKSYLNMNTYVKWGDPWFWEKLKYALPHPPEFTKGVKRKFFATTKPSIQNDNIKSELINYPGAPGITTANDETSEKCVKNGSVPNGTKSDVKIDIGNMNNECEKLSVDDINRINNVALPSVEIFEKIKNSAKDNIIQCSTV